MKTKLGSLGDIFIGLTYKPEDVSEQGVIVLRSGNIQDGNLVFDDIVRVSKDVSDRFFVKENDILICSRNGSARLVGKSVLIPHLNEQMSFGAFMTIIRTPYNSYLKHFFDSEAFRRQLGSSATSTINQITKNMLDNIEVDLPEKNDMDSIVCILDKINQIISKQKTQLSKFDELIKSRFVELFNGKYDTVKIGDIFSTTSGGTPSKSHPEYYENGTIPWLSSGEVNIGVIHSVKNYITQEGVDNSSAKMVPENSVVIAMYGATAGQVGLLRIATTTNQAVCSVLPDKRYVPEYLYYAIKSKKDWMISQCAGGAQPNISQGVIKRMEIIDSPYELQKQFAAFVEQTDKSKFEIQKSLEKLEILKKSLMQKYFG